MKRIRGVREYCKQAESMGLDPLKDFLWKPEVKPDTLNAMVLSWPMKKMPAEAGKDEEALARAGIFEWFFEGEYIYIRPKAEPSTQSHE